MGAGMERRSQSQIPLPKEQASLDFGISFMEYSHQERQALAAAVREKPIGELTPEEERYRIWAIELESGDAQPDYRKN